MKTKPHIPEVGQRLFVVTCGYRVTDPSTKAYETVLKVGRKYFTTAEEGHPEHMWNVWHLDTWREKCDYSSRHSIYPNREAWELEKEHCELSEALRKLFYYASTPFDLDQLRRIKAITEEGKQ